MKLTHVAILLTSAGMMHGAQPARAPTNPIAEPLAKAIGEICLKDNPSAKDYSRIADTTLDFARRSVQSGGPPSRNVIESALDAVDAGEGLDAKGADWPKLRTDLQSFLQEDPNKQPQSKDKSNSPQRDKGDKNNQDDPNPGDENSDSKDQSEGSGDQQKQDKSGKQDQNQSSENKSDPSENSENQEKPDQAAQKNNSSAFGDMKDQPTPTPEEPKQPSEPETQKVGGQPNKESNPLAASQDPQLAIPLQKLEHLRQQDSPAKLFRMMDGDAAAVPNKKGKDW